MCIRDRDLIDNKDLKKSLKLEKYVSDKVGLPTLNDIIEELDKPGRDPVSYTHLSIAGV